MSFVLIVFVEIGLPVAPMIGWSRVVNPRLALSRIAYVKGRAGIKPLQALEFPPVS